MNPLGPVLIVLLLPISAIGLLLYTDTGIEPALFSATVKTFVALFAIAGFYPTARAGSPPARKADNRASGSAPWRGRFPGDATVTMGSRTT